MDVNTMAVSEALQRALDELDDKKLREKLFKYIERYQKTQEHTREIQRGQTYARNLNIHNFKINNEYVNRYGLYQDDGGKWRSSVKLIK